MRESVSDPESTILGNPYGANGRAALALMKLGAA